MGPEKSEYQVYFMIPKKVRFPIISRIAQALFCRLLIKRIKRILIEDGSIWKQVQIGASIVLFQES